jgi:alkanesulfonate monooxygenase SsuD/methylene tetrahydromethanopterin reductase-like flavin-dependent oxidoreductase (luciferase family)
VHPERLAITVIPGTGWSAQDIRTVAQEAEEAGFDAIFTTEINNDAMATAQLMGTSTQRIRVGTWIANIYARHAYTCAKGAELIAEATDGRFILGLGVSHQPVNEALGIDMTDAPHDLRRYVSDVRRWLRGEGPTTYPSEQPPARHVPIYVAVLSLAAVERAAEEADGIMPTQWSPERITRCARRVARGRARAPQLAPLDVTLGLPTFIGDDLDELRDTARQDLAIYTSFPYFQRMYRASGFAKEADQMEMGAGPDALSDRLLDSFCLFGPIDRCKERLAEFRAAGVDLPILNPPVGLDAARAMIHAFQREPAFTR